MKLVLFLRSNYQNNPLATSITRFIASVIGAVLFNFVWLILFISFGKSPGDVIRILLWCLAPIIIASGYAYGIIVYDRSICHVRDSFLFIFSWALFGCVLGEIITLSSGPMVMGLSIISFGGLAVLFREFNIIRKRLRGA
jgi:hypothetical protein